MHLSNIRICRFGWFWECPSGGEKCQYRHALPPGFVLKAQRKAEAEAAKANVISIEEFLEVEVSLKILILGDDLVAEYCVAIVAAQVGLELDACDTRILRKVEEDTYG